MAQHGEFFPENPRNTEELVDLLAQRAAAAQRMLNSMSAEQRAELMELSQQAFGDPRLAQAHGPAGRPAAGPAPRRGLGRAAAGSAATTRWAWARPPGRWSSSGSSTRWPSSWRRATRAPGWRTSTWTRSAPSSATRPGSTPGRWPSWSASCSAHGLFERAPDGSLRLSPKALRRLGESALRDVVDRIGSRRGERETHRSGAAGEATGATRPWAFGDTEAWNVPRTLLNAQLRRAGGDDRRLDVTDVEIVETEQRTRAAVALCVDTSWSMVAGRALGADEAHRAGAAPADLHPVPRRRPEADHLRPARAQRRAGRAGRRWRAPGSKGTNLHHALLLAGEHLRRHPGRAAGGAGGHRR